MTREFIRLPEFERQCKRIKLSEDDIRDIEILLLSNPSIGSVMVGTGGVRKLRESPENTNRGKRSGVRVIYIDFPFFEKIYMLSVYRKGDVDNLNKAERNELRKFVKILEFELQRGTKQWVVCLKA